MKQSSAQNPAIFHQHVKATDLVLHHEFFPPFLTALHALKKSNFKDRRRLETNWHSTENKIELFSGFCRTTSLESFSSTQGCEGLNKRGLTNFFIDPENICYREGSSTMIFFVKTVLTFFMHFLAGEAPSQIPPRGQLAFIGFLLF